MRDMNKPILLNNYVELTKNVLCLLAVITISLLIFTAVFSDLRSKYSTEKQLQRIKISECRYKFEVNRCDDPVPDVR